jgi:hypothetical protein
MVNGLGMGADGASYIAAASARGGYVTLHSTAGTNFVGSSKGYLPWHTYQFPMGKQDDPTDWYDPTGKKPRLRFTSASTNSSGDGEVIIETVHKY